MRRALGLTAALASLTLVLAGCTGSDAVKSGPGDAHNPGFQFQSGTAPGQVYPRKERKAAEDVHGTLIDGGKMQLSAAKGKVVVLNFWASWCGPCQTETPQFDILYRKIHKSGVEFYGIDDKDDRGNAQAFVKTNNISFPIVFDQEGQTALQLGNIPAGALPFTVLIDRTGKVAAVYEERLSPVDLKNGVNKLLAER